MTDVTEKVYKSLGDLKNTVSKRKKRERKKVYFVNGWDDRIGY